ncbi:hypothetical protein IIA15_08620 [candidate division TA06 bacterium]|nr:hypothetical protein [candidate division TA06 bacterium]
MRRRVPLTITFIFGIFMTLQFFVPHRVSQVIYQEILKWFIIIFTFSLIFGSLVLMRLHSIRIRRRTSGWGYSLVTLTSLIGMIVIGFKTGIKEGSLFMNLFNHVQVPLEATMFSILAFFMASAAYRAFRARTVDATLLLGAAIVMMIGRVPLGTFLWSGFPDLTEWILEVPSMAAKRGIMIGVGLGVISTALKIILGIERSYIGGGE